MNAQLLYDGLKAMILGMAMVYLFLVTMIYVMKLTSKLLKPYTGFLEEKKPAPARKNKPAAAEVSNDAVAKAVAEAALIYSKSGKNSGADITVSCEGKSMTVNVAPGSKPAAAAAAPAPAVSGEETEIKSPLPGTVTRVEVAEEHIIFKGDVLAVIEAMKMETEIRSEFSGIVKQVLISSGDIVTADQVIFTIGVEK